MSESGPTSSDPRGDGFLPGEAHAASAARRLIVSLGLTLGLVSLIVIPLGAVLWFKVAAPPPPAPEAYIDFIAGCLKPALREGDMAAVQRMGRLLIEDEIVFSLELTDAEGTPYLSIEKSTFGEDFDSSMGFQDVRILTEAGKTLARLRVTVLPPDRALLGRQALYLALGCTVLSLAALVFLAGRWVQVTIERPLNRLADGLGNALADSEGPPVRGVVHREFLPLARELKRMVDRAGERLGTLRAAEWKYRSVFETAEKGMFQGTEEGRLIRINPAFAAMLGYDDPEEAMDRIGEAAHRMYATFRDSDEIRHRLREQGRVTGYETELVDRSGRPFRVVLNIRAALDPHGNIRYYEGCVTDISARSERESRFTEQAEAEAENRVRAELVGEVGYEIRTPINAILGLAGILLKTGTTAAQRDYLSKIDASARIMRGVVEEFVRSSEEDEPPRIESRPFGLRHLMERLSDIFAEKTAKKHLEMITTVDDDVPDALEGDPPRLEQVLIHLVDNAVKFTAGGEVVIRVSVRDIRADRAVLGFSIRDTGLGIPSDQLARLFTPGNGDGRRARLSGLGPGLVACKRLIELMDGEIEVETQPDQGSTFFFTARFGVSADAPAPDQALPPGLRGLRVAVVDDNAAVCGMLEGLLTRFNFDPLCLRSGEAALGFLDAEGAAPDLLLVDWRMPGMDGIEFTRRVRRRFQRRDLPIVLMAEMGAEEMAERAAAAGVDGVLLKPVKPSILFDTVMEVFGPRVMEAFSEGGGEGNLSEVVERIRGIRVLLVEDHAINRQVAARILSGADILVETAGDGREAVEKVAAAGAGEIPPFDAVLMDIQMPRMGGLAAAGAIREDPRFADLPIIAMTAHTLPRDRRRSLEAGMNDHVTKPIDEEALFRTLARWVNGGEGDHPSEAASRRSGEEALREVLDTAQVLGRLGGNRLLFDKLLRDFVADHGDADRRIRAALEKEDEDQALGLLRGLKGAAGNLAAREVHQAALSLEMELHHGPGDLEALLEDLCESHRRLVAVIEEREPAPAAPPSPEEERKRPLPRTLPPMVRELHRSLIEGELPPETMLAEIKRLMKGLGHQDRLNRLGDQIRRSRMKEARNILATIAWSLGISLDGE